PTRYTICTMRMVHFIRQMVSAWHRSQMHRYPMQVSRKCTTVWQIGSGDGYMMLRWMIKKGRYWCMCVIRQMTTTGTITPIGTESGGMMKSYVQQDAGCHRSLPKKRTESRFIRAD